MTLAPRQQMQLKIEDTVTELRKELHAFKGVKDAALRNAQRVLQSW